MGTLKPGTLPMCHKRTPSHMAHIPYLRQVQRSTVILWNDIKATESFHWTDLPFSIFHNILFHVPTVKASTRGYVFTISPLRPPLFDLSP